MIWIVVITVVLAVSFVLYYQRQYENEKKVSTTKINKVASYFKCKLIEESINRSLAQMDKTNGFYKDEDEANRELTTCLNLLGHTASYQYVLDNKRTADILVDNCIIEGKLSPDNTEIDRVIGQVSDYLSLSKRIFVVLYGYIDKQSIERLNNRLVIPNPLKVKLIYLNGAQRVRRS